MTDQGRRSEDAEDIESGDESDTQYGGTEDTDALEQTEYVEESADDEGDHENGSDDEDETAED